MALQSLLLGLKLKHTQPVQFGKYLGHFIEAHYGEKVSLAFDSYRQLF